MDGEWVRCDLMNELNLTPILFFSKESYLHDLAGILGPKRVKKGHTTPYAAFCSMKLEAVNAGTFSLLCLRGLH